MAPAPVHPSAGSPLARAATLALHVKHGGRRERMVFGCATTERVAEIERGAATWLGPEEARSVATLKFAKRRNEFLLGRFAAKSAILDWIGHGALHEIDVAAGAFQQPVVHGPGNTPLGVTLAHSGDVAIALAHEQGHPLGIDLERHDPMRIEVVRTQVAPSELPADRGAVTESATYFLLWSAKEALSKALRCGLTCPFELLATRGARVDGSGVCQGTFANFGQYQFVAWMLGDYAFAVVGSRDADLAAAAPSLREFTLGTARDFLRTAR